MTSIPFVKLKEPGESITLTVHECKKMETGRYPGVGFIGSDGTSRVVVEVPDAAADRQLSRLGHTRESIVGRSVTISRAANPNAPDKPYWNVALANAPVAHTNGKHAPEAGGPIAGLDDLPDEPPPVDEAYAPVASVSIGKLDALFNLYDACFDHAMQAARKAHGLNPDVAAIAATLFIQANERGIR